MNAHNARRRQGGVDAGFACGPQLWSSSKVGIHGHASLVASHTNCSIGSAGRIAGKSLHRQDWRKGRAPAHTVTLPKFGAEVLTGLYAITGPSGTVLKNRNGGLLSLSNIRSSLREALEPYPDLKWVTPHSFRRSVGTVVAEGLGIDAAQQSLGHAQRETTERHYVQRSTAGPDTRAVLDKWAGKRDE